MDAPDPLSYSFTIEPRPAHLADGWRLRLWQDGQEVGGGVLPDWDDAYQTGQDWMQSQARA